MALSDNLQGWWCPSLDTAGNGTTTLTDLSGNGNNGTLTNMDAATDWVADTDSGGVRALDFDGSVQSVNMLSAALPLTGDMTLSFWFAYRNNNIGRILQQYTATGPGRTSITINQNEGGGVTSNSLNCFHPDLRMSEFGLSVDTWQHVVLQRSSNQGLLYVDGVLADTDADWTEAIEDTPFALGSLGAFGRGSHNGLIDAVAIYNRAITSEEITELYNGGRSLQLVDLSTGLQGWWCPSLDTAGNGTTTLTDLSGNGNNGTLTNMDAATDWVADTDNGGVRALEFDVAVDNQYVTTGDIDSPDVITVGAWIKPYSSYSYAGIMAKRSGSVAAWAMDLSESASRFYVANPGYSVKTFTLPVISGWNLLCTSFENTAVTTSTVKCYLNGVQVAVANLGRTMYMNDYPITIGDTRGTDPTDKCFSGLIDGVFVYNRVLTADEVTQLYNGGRSLNLLASGGSGNIAHVLRSIQQQQESVVAL